MRRKETDIRNGILKSLEAYPKNQYELSIDLRSDPRTIKKHIEYLEKLGKVKKAQFNIVKRNNDNTLWIKI